MREVGKNTKSISTVMREAGKNTKVYQPLCVKCGNMHFTTLKLHGTIVFTTNDWRGERYE